MSDTPCKPVFVQPLLDITLNEGEKLKLHAAINAHPEPEVRFDIEIDHLFKFSSLQIDHLVL